MDMITEKGNTAIQMETAPRASVPAPLRIAFCLPEFEPLQNVMSGKPADATYILQSYIITGLHDRGHTLTFLAKRDLNHNVCTHDPQRPTVAPQTWSKKRWFDVVSRGAWRIQQLLRVPYLSLFSNLRLFDACLQCLPGHDIVYERNGLYRMGVAMACKRLQLPYVLFVEADEILEHDIMGQPITGIKRWGTKMMFQYNLNAADCVICVSEQSKAHLATAWSIPTEKLVVFPNAVDVKRFRPCPEARSEIRTLLKVYDSPLIIFVGNFYKWHDVATLLEAFAQILATHPDARLVLIGDGVERPAMMQHAANLKLGDAVQFTGFVPHDEVPRFMSAADIAVAPYPPMQHDLWLSPLKLFEYMAAGAAVVASAVGQPTKVVKDGNNGLLVPPGDVSAMAAALNRLIHDERLRLRLGQQAREYVIRQHSWEHYVARLERLYGAVIAGQPVHQV
ncbi:MAG: hypothetical protein DCC55_18660 [Chloroflexi bacterium]|nr:MAG: hypothetical protein DCC55_18660 [Chloroflexota bacterium]